MPRINPVDHESATGKTRNLLDAVKTKVGFVPNLFSTLAVSPASLEAYLGFSEAMSQTLDAKTRELIALAVAEANGCEYCASAHTAIGRMVGLKQDEVMDARRGTSTDPKRLAILNLARNVALTRGKIDQSKYDDAVAAGLSEREIVEVVGNTVLNVFSNSFNNVAQTVVDFPEVEPLEVPA